MNIVIACLISFFSLTVLAEDSLLEFKNARIYLPMKGSTSTAGYAEVINNSVKEISFAIDSAKPFKAVELHETKILNGSASMQKVNGFLIHKKSTLLLSLGGSHIMLFDATKELKLNDILAIKFIIDGKSKIVNFKVISR